MKSKSQEQWKKYFESANRSIYEIIHNAIRVAALEDPKEFRLRRGQIAEKLFSCKLSECCCDGDQSKSDVQNTITAIFKGCKKRCAINKPVENSDDSVSRKHGHNNGQIIILDEISKDSISEAEIEKLTDAIDNERENIHQVLEIKAILENNEDQETELFVSLRKLQLIVFSPEVLEVTKIGTTVSDLQRHWSRHIRELAKCILDCWKTMIEEWVDSSADLAEGSKHPNPGPLPDDECVLPTPPIDEGLLFVSQPGVRLSEFFDDIDENGNPEKCNKFLENGRNPPAENKRELKLQVIECPATSMSGNWRQKAKRDCVEKLLSSKYSTSPDKGYESEKTDGKNDQTKTPAENERKLKPQPVQSSASVSTNKREKARHESTEILVTSTNARSSCLESSSKRIRNEIEMIDEKTDQTKPKTENKRKLELQLVQSSASIDKRQKARHESTEKLGAPTNARPSDHRNLSQGVRKPKVFEDVDNGRETHQKKDKHKVQHSPNSRPKDTRVRLDAAAATEVKSETSKRRRLWEDYQEHERARKNRMRHLSTERFDLPKHGFTHRRIRSKSNRDRNQKYNWE